MWLGNIWVAVAAQLDKYGDAGSEQPPTEDVVRFATIKQLAAAGVEPSRLSIRSRSQRISASAHLHDEKLSYEHRKEARWLTMSKW
jgi:hypothetical protein